MERKAYKRAYYLNRIQNHQCAWCGKTDDRTLTGRIYCEECRQKHIEYNRSHPKKRKPYDSDAERKWRTLKKQNHICIDCGRQDAYTLNGRTRCAECAQKDAARRRETRDNVKNAESSKAARDRWRAEGRCTRCGKTKWNDGYMTCPECRAYCIKRRAEKRTSNYPRGEHGICWLCNKEPVIPGKRLCETCQAGALERLEKARAHTDSENHIWRRLNFRRR